MLMAKPDNDQRGATLVELVMTIVIISIAIAGVVGAFSLIAGRSADPLNQTRAVALAQLYMDEILAKAFADQSPVGGGDTVATDCGTPGPEPGESRNDFNDVDDYHGLNTAPEDSEEDSLLGYSGFTVSITVSCAGSELSLASNDDAKRVTIRITDPSRGDYLFSAYRVNF